MLLPMLAAGPDVVRQEGERKPGTAMDSIRPGRTVSLQLTNGRRMTGLFLGAVHDSADAQDAHEQVFRIRTDWQVMDVPVDEIAWVRVHHATFLVPAALALGLAIDIAVFHHFQEHPIILN